MKTGAGMAISSNGIAARAFRLAEMSPISSFADDSAEARAAAAEYPNAITQCLEANDWSFASRLADLPEITGLVADPDLTYTFKRPSDMIRLIEVWPAETQWRLDHDALRADQPAPLRIRYTAKVDDPTRLPALFATAVSYRLAALLAPHFTTSANRAESLFEMSITHLRDAARADRRSASSQRYDGADSRPDWVSEGLR